MFFTNINSSSQCIIKYHSLLEVLIQVYLVVAKIKCGCNVYRLGIILHVRTYRSSLPGWHNWSARETFIIKRSQGSEFEPLVGRRLFARLSNFYLPGHLLQYGLNYLSFASYRTYVCFSSFFACVQHLAEVSPVLRYECTQVSRDI